VDPSNPADSPSSEPLTLGLYANDFVYFSMDPEVEAEFQHLLKQQVTVNFMERVEWFLGTHFQWSVTPDVVQEFRYTLAKQVSCLTLLKKTTFIIVTSPPTLPPIGPASQLMLVRSQMKTKTIPLSSNVEANTKILWAALVGSHKAHILTSPLHICFSRHTITSLHEAI
jgi:hypothetical protein